MPFTPTIKQLEALRIYASANGRTWKSKLRQDWQRALYLSVPEVFWPELQRLRGEGSSWLTKFKLPEALPDPPKSEACGCCSNGCVCKIHKDLPLPGRPVNVCDYHVALPYAPLDKDFRYDARLSKYVRVPVPA